LKGKGGVLLTNGGGKESSKIRSEKETITKGKDRHGIIYVRRVPTYKGKREEPLQKSEARKPVVRVAPR